MISESRIVLSGGTFDVDTGGYCDCEVLNNAEEVVEDAVPGYRDANPA
jgi:hypothetical protein